MNLYMLDAFVPKESEAFLPDWLSVIVTVVDSESPRRRTSEAQLEAVLQRHENPDVGSHGHA